MKKIGISILGLGIVGSGTYNILSGHKEFYKIAYGVEIDVQSVLELDLQRIEDLGIDKSKISASIAEICSNPEIDLVVEAIGGTEPAKSYVIAVLKAGKSVITSNTELVCKYGDELKLIAAKNNCGLFFGASCVGGVPVIRTLIDNLHGNRILAVTAIVNGAANYILTQMTSCGKTYSEALLEAQSLGFASADPALDVEGFDSAYKLSIILSLSFHAKVAYTDVYREGIVNIDVADIEFGKALGYRLKPLAIGRNTENGIDVRVHPAFIKESHPLASVNGNFNAVFVTGDVAGDVMLYGKGAGALPAGSAIVGDILYYATHENGSNVAFHDVNNSSSAKFVTNFECGYYIRLRAKDKAGVLSRVSAILNKCGISLSDVRQERCGAYGEVSLILATHKAKENTVKKALGEINSASDLAKVVSVIRIAE